MSKTILRAVLAVVLVFLCLSIGYAGSDWWPCRTSDVTPSSPGGSGGACPCPCSPDAGGYWYCSTGWVYRCENGSASENIGMKYVLPFNRTRSHSSNSPAGGSDTSCCYACTVWHWEWNAVSGVWVQICDDSGYRPGYSSYTASTNYNEYTLPFSAGCSGTVLPSNPSCSYNTSTWDNIGCRKDGAGTEWKWACNGCPACYSCCDGSTRTNCSGAGGYFPADCPPPPP